MNREDIIRMAREAGLWEADISKPLFDFAALVEAKAAAAEREACAKVAGWLWQQFQDTKEAHERNFPEPFKPERFGFDQSTVQQSKRLMDAIRARGNV